MSGKVLFACSKCFSRHPFEELSSSLQLCKNCRGSSSVVKCAYCRSEFQPSSKSQTCKKCEHNLSKYGKPGACECCKIVAAFGSNKCMRCASYEGKYGPPVQCEECKQRSAFDKRDENKKVNGKLLCWLCTCAFKRALLKAQQDGRISAKKRPHEKSHRESSATASRSKSTRTAESLAKTTSTGVVTASSATGLDIPDKISRIGSGNGMVGVVSIADPNSADHVVAMTNLKERIVSLEKRLQMKDKELLEKDKLLTELKGKNFENENDMRNKLRDVDRLHDMKVENLNRKISNLLREIAALKKSSKKNEKNGAGISTNSTKEKEREKRENLSPKEEEVSEERTDKIEDTPKEVAEEQQQTPIKSEDDDEDVEQKPQAKDDDSSDESNDEEREDKSERDSDSSSHSTN